MPKQKLEFPMKLNCLNLLQNYKYFLRSLNVNILYPLIQKGPKYAQWPTFLEKSNVLKLSKIPRWGGGSLNCETPLNILLMPIVDYCLGWFMRLINSSQSFNQNQGINRLGRGMKRRVGRKVGEDVKKHNKLLYKDCFLMRWLTNKFSIYKERALIIWVIYCEIKAVFGTNMAVMVFWLK